MVAMTEPTPTPAPAAVPTFGEWFRALNPPATLAVMVLAQTAGAYFGMALLRVFLGDYPFPSFLEFLPLLGFLVALESVETYWRYRRLIKVRRESGVVHGQTAEGGAAKATTSSGDSPVAPLTIPGIDSQGHSGKGPSDGNHSGSHHSDHGGDSGGHGGGDSGGGDGGGGGGD